MASTVTSAIPDQNDQEPGMANSALRALQKGLLEHIGTKLPRFGFDKRRQGQSFYRLEPFGRSAFHVAFIEHATDFDVTADVAVRIDAVEELVNAENRLLSRKEKQNTFTAGAELGNIAEGRQRRWTVSNPNHLPLVASSIVQALESIGLPYLEEISDPERLLYILSGHDQKAWMSSPIHHHRCKTIVALAVYLGKKEAVPALIDECTSFLRDRGDPGIEAFRIFVSYFQHR